MEFLHGRRSLYRARPVRQKALESKKFYSLPRARLSFLREIPSSFRLPVTIAPPPSLPPRTIEKTRKGRKKVCAAQSTALFPVAHKASDFPRHASMPSTFTALHAHRLFRRVSYNEFTARTLVTSRPMRGWKNLNFTREVRMCWSLTILGEVTYW